MYTVVKDNLRRWLVVDADGATVAVTTTKKAAQEKADALNTPPKSDWPKWPW